MVSQPTLYVFATKHNYQEIVNRLKNNETSSLEWTDFHGNTVLHVLCRQDRMSQQAIDAVLEKRPQMVGLPNHSSWTPLHLACQRRTRLTATSDPALDSIRLHLIRACPSGVSKRRESGYARETPFELACLAQADIPVVEAMLRIDPTLARFQIQACTMSSNALQTLWNAGLKDHVALILLTALFGGVVEDRTSFLLHAACFQRIPRDCFDYFLRHNTNQLMVQDYLGNLPIHYAVSQQVHVAQPYTEYVVSSLLRLAPQAAQVPNHEGRLPIHCALDHSLLTWSKGGLCYVAPRALMTQDPRTGLFPFQMSAIHANRSRNHLSTLYEILRAAPEVLLAGSEY